MADEPLYVEVVCADGRVWEGEATQVTARTTEGDVGILARHEPFLAALVPGAVEVITVQGEREIMAVDGGFVSVADNRVSVIAQYAKIAQEISLEGAEKELREAEKALNEGETDEATRRHFNRASAQVKAAQKAHDQAH